MALVTLAEVKEALEIDTTVGKHDAYLTNLINRVGAWLVRYVGYIIESASVTEYHNGTGDSSIWLRQKAIQSITSVHESQDQSWGPTTEIVSTDYIFDPVTRRIWKQGDVPFLRGVQNVRVVMTGGFASVPDDIKMAAIELVAAKYNRRKTTGMSSQSLGDGSVAYFSVSELSKETRELLLIRRKAKILS